MKVSQIKENFGYKLIGTKFMKRMVIATLRVFPDEIAEKVSKSCWFISSFENGWAFVLRGDDIKKDHYAIFLSDDLLKETESQISYTIAHEIGHVILGHRNSIGKVQSKEEIKKQEREAQEFVMKYLLQI